MANRYGRELTARQQLFVKAWVENGGFIAPAARAAGYTAKTARFGSYRLLDNPRVLAAIRIEVQKRLDAGVALGAQVLVKLAQGAKSEAVQLQAAEALLNRGGMRLASLTQHEHLHLIRDERSDAELRARIAELQRELGINPKVIDAEVLPALPDHVDAEAEALPAALPGGGEAALLDHDAEAESLPALPDHVDEADHDIFT